MLNVITVEEAASLAASLARPVAQTEILSLPELPGRVAAADITAKEDVPVFARSTMDGYAVFAANTFGAGESSPVDLTLTEPVQMGKPAAFTLYSGEAARIPTGGDLPHGANAVVPMEYAEEDGFGSVLIYKGAAPREYVVRRGDDIAENAVLFRKGTRFTSVSVGALAAAGIETCAVLRRPRVGLFSTGVEVDPVSAPAAPGRVRDVNSHLISAMLYRYGCDPVFYGIAPDAEEAIAETLERAAGENDLVLLSGGSSAGEQDLTARVLSRLGQVLAHGVAMKPGKPTVIGRVGDVPVFGLPGHPAACCFVTAAVVRPALETLCGAPLPLRLISARLSENVSSNHGRTEFLCVKLEGDTAIPIYGKSGVVSQLSRADGYIRIDRDREGLEAGAEVAVRLF